LEHWEGFPHEEVLRKSATSLTTDFDLTGAAATLAE
jgi:hypothetical protein